MLPFSPLYEALGPGLPPPPCHPPRPGAAGSWSSSSRTGVCCRRGLVLPHQERALRLMLAAGEVRPCGSSCDDQGLQVHGGPVHAKLPRTASNVADAPLSTEPPG